MTHTAHDDIEFLALLAKSSNNVLRDQAHEVLAVKVAAIPHSQAGKVRAGP